MNQAQAFWAVALLCYAAFAWLAFWWIRRVARWQINGNGLFVLRILNDLLVGFAACVVFFGVMLLNLQLQQYIWGANYKGDAVEEEAFIWMFIFAGFAYGVLFFFCVALLSDLIIGGLIKSNYPSKKSILK